MDIVQRIAVAELGGSLRLETVVGGGTTFLLEVPLSVTILDAFTSVKLPMRARGPIDESGRMCANGPTEVFSSRRDDIT